jgi:hypothetical protein
VDKPARDDDGPAAKDAAVVDLGERKERVLHTRVPKSLDRRIKRRARHLGLSVSTVVRSVLLSTFGLVEDIVTDSADIALSLAGEDVGARRDARARARGSSARDEAAVDVLGWQEAILNLNAVCEQCNAVLRKGTRAAIGIRGESGPRVIICKRCLGKLTRGGS